MKVLYDFRSYGNYNQRGVGRFMYELFESAVRQSEEELYILLDRRAVAPEFPGAVRKKVGFCYLEDFQRGQYRDGEFDVFINTCAILPYFSMTTAVSEQYPPAVLAACRKWTTIMHDYILVFYREYTPSEDCRMALVLQMEATRHLDQIFTNSQFTTAMATKYTGLQDSYFTCLYAGANEKEFKTANTDLPYGESKRGHHLVYVSGAAPQKNNVGFAKAFCKAYREGRIPEDARLYLLGQADEGHKELVKHEVERLGCKYGKQVLVTGYIPEEKMLELVGTAKSSMFPSFLEGFGLPILESYAAGTPCFASGLTATRELVLRECTFDPFDEGSMADAVALAYQDDELCARSLEFGRELLKKFSWDNAAHVLLDKCRELSEEEG